MGQCAIVGELHVWSRIPPEGFKSCGIGISFDKVPAVRQILVRIIRTSFIYTCCTCRRKRRIIYEIKEEEEEEEEEEGGGNTIDRLSEYIYSSCRERPERFTHKKEAS